MTKTTTSSTPYGDQCRGKILIVGINPSSKNSVKPSSTFKRLGEWMDYVNMPMFSFMNCISRPGKYCMGDVQFDILKECSKGYDKVIALGNFPSSALNKIGVKHFTMPHPSGLNRKLNDRHYEISMLDQLKDYIHEHRAD